jgi:thiol-disulfide isomerase/thioredoxin
MTDECVCGAKVKSIKTKFELYDGKVTVNDIDAYYCPKCDKEILTMDQALEAERRIEELTRKYRAYTIKKRIAKVGNSLSIPVSKELSEYMSLEKGMQVRITVKDKKSIIVDVI